MKLTAYHYELPLKSPFRTAEQSYSARWGILLRLDHQDITAWGEAAPLPGFSREDVTQIRSQLAELAPGLKRLFLHEEENASDIPDNLPEKPFPSHRYRASGQKTGERDSGDGEESPEQSAPAEEKRQEGISDYPRVTRFHREHRVLPSLQFAIDTLWTDFHSRREQVSPGSLLFGRMPNAIPVNAVLSIRESREQSLKEAERLIEKGYSTLKVKLGREPSGEIALLRELRSRHPDVTIRADANRGWELKEALAAFSKMEDLELEYCEEPLKQCSPKHLEALTSRTEVPVALDETLSEPEFGTDLLEFTKFFILKPMVMGGMANLFATNDLADGHDIGIIVTNSLEGSTGRSMTALIAGGIGSGSHAHGLATGSLLEKDFTATPSPEDRPRIHPPMGPGLPPADPDLLSTISTETVEL